VPPRVNPKSFRPTEDDAALMRELLDFYGVTSESELTRMAYRALNRERLALEDLYVRPKTATRAGSKQGRDEPAKR
jgi:hypothetical protein